ncbi:PREDICTED: UDP-glycosyltransferase 87A2-like [Ipomoea nil]|uniref:UDP-glycosyltransferase 87A2-like n=1 Tax=Ipomoea nil TaxID=35883 RepID=UPI000901AB21|nr:PREDICTED: UDP-glycosyltransferase 87A2-like [Ipomoea nil]
MSPTILTLSPCPLSSSVAGAFDDDLDGGRCLVVVTTPLPSLVPDVGAELADFRQTKEADKETSDGGRLGSPVTSVSAGGSMLHRKKFVGWKLEPSPSITLGGQYLVFTSVAELESASIIEALRPKLKTPIYSIGTAIPYYFPIQGDGDEISCPDYLTWLDAQPANSVLYISQGSFLSLSAGQLEEIVAGVCESGVCFFWVARENTERLRERGGGGEQGLIVPWCDQLRVLRHRSVGGFWSHCGWNSTKEGAFAGVPFLAFPIALDQFTNCKQIVEDWKIGWKVKKGCDNDGIVRRREIAQLLRRFMGSECNESKEAIPVGQAVHQQIRRTTVPSANQLSGIFRDRWTWLNFPADKRFSVKLNQGG